MAVTEAPPRNIFVLSPPPSTLWIGHLQALSSPQDPVFRKQMEYKMLGSLRKLEHLKCVSSKILPLLLVLSTSVPAAAQEFVCSGYEPPLLPAGAVAKKSRLHSTTGTVNVLVIYAKFKTRRRTFRPRRPSPASSSKRACREVFPISTTRCPVGDSRLRAPYWLNGTHPIDRLRRM